MSGRSDLIIEMMDAGKIKTDGVTGNKGEIAGVAVKEEWNKKRTIKTTTVRICTEEGEQKMQRPRGNYITMEIPGLKEEKEDLMQEAGKLLEKQLRFLLKDHPAKHMLVIGLGNREVTADAIGPLTVDRLFVTRHIYEEYKNLMKNCRKVSALVPGVMAQTGMEAMEVIHAVVDEINPDVVLVVDALAARSAKRLNTTIQLTDTGICPGAGVGNNRQELSERSIGRPVLAIGVPTVLDAISIAKEEEADGMEDLFVMSRSIDSAVHYISELLAEGINRTNRRDVFE